MRYDRIRQERWKWNVLRKCVCQFDFHVYVMRCFTVVCPILEENPFESWDNTKINGKTNIYNWNGFAAKMRDKRKILYRYSPVLLYIAFKNEYADRKLTYLAFLYLEYIWISLWFVFQSILNSIRWCVPPTFIWIYCSDIPIMLSNFFFRQQSINSFYFSHIYIPTLHKHNLEIISSNIRKSVSFYKLFFQMDMKSVGSFYYENFVSIGSDFPSNLNPSTIPVPNL